MKARERGINIQIAFLIGMLAASSASAWTITCSESNQPYLVSAADLLQRNVSSVETNGMTLYFEGGTAGIPAYLTDGTTGAGNRDNTFTPSGGAVIYTLDTETCPDGYDITGLDSYTGWQDGGRVDQKYEVSFRTVGSGTFGNAITNTYASGMKETRICVRDINLSGVAAVKFTFLTPQENGGVGYKEFDVFGMATTTNFTSSGNSSSTAYPVSDSDLLQSAQSATNATFLYYTETGFTNALLPALTDGEFGSANKYIGTCAVKNGTVTYTLDTSDHPAGYTISALDTYSGWTDGGRDNQNFWVSFRKVGESVFGDALTVSYAGSANLSHVSVTNLDLAGVDAVRFIFLTQENNGAGYKEFDVTGTAPAYTAITRRDSGSQTVASNDTAQVLLTEGTGTPGTLTLGAPVTVIDTLTQGATDDAAVLDPAGQTLALSGLFLRADAGGMEIGTGTGNGTLAGTQRSLVLGTWSTNAFTVRANVTTLADTGGLLKTGTGTLTLSGTNMCPGGTEVTAGSLRLTEGGSLGSGAVNVTGGTLQLDGGAVSPALSNSMRVAFVDAAFNQTGGSLSYSGYLQAQNTALNLSGGSSYIGMDALLGWGGTNTTATISGSHAANWRTARFSSGAVNLYLQGGGKLYTDRIYSYAGATGSIFFDGGTLGVSSISPTLSPSDWIGVQSGSLTLYVQDGGAVIDTGNGSVSINRPFLRDGTSTGGLTKIGRNTLMLTNAVFCTYAGDTTVLDGTLKLASLAAPLPGGTRLSLAADAVLDLNGADQTVAELNGAGRVVNSSSVGAVLTVGGNDVTTNFCGHIEGAVALVKTGSGTWTLSGANAYTNGTQILGGTLCLSPLPVPIVNAGFELPLMASGSWSYLTDDGLSDGWKMSGHGGTNIGSGISRNNAPTNAPWVDVSPEGAQICFIQTTSFCLQTVTVSRAATYCLSFSAANRPGHTADNLDVLIDGTMLVSWPYTAFASSGVFQTFATNCYLTAGMHEVKFSGTSPGGDTATAIDDVRLIVAGNTVFGNLQTNTAVEVAAGAALDLGGTQVEVSDLSGSGTVSNGTLAVSGTIAPGGVGSIGTLTLSATVSLNGTLLLDTALDGTCDRLNVEGGLDLSGVDLVFQDLTQFKKNATYLIATCTPGMLTGRFASTNLESMRAISYNNAMGRVLLVCSGTLFMLH